MNGHLLKIKKLPKNVAKLSIWDIDDTLLDSRGVQELKIYVYKKKELVKILSTSEFNSYKKKPGEEFSFTAFRDPSLLAKAKAISATVSKAKKEIHSRDTMVLTLSARSKMSDKNLFLRVFKNVFGLDLHTSTSHAVFAGDLSLTKKISTPSAKAQMIDECLAAKKFNQVCMYDDHKENLIAFKKLNSKYKEVVFDAYLVRNGIITKF